MTAQIAELFCNARTERELQHAMDEVAAHIGANSYAATRFLSTSHGGCADALHCLPHGYLSTFDGEEFPNDRDPVMQHLRRSSIPIVWDRSTYVDAGEGKGFVPMADFGVRSGAALALHLDEGRHFVVGFNWSSDVVPCEPIALLQTTAVFAEPAFYRVWNAWDGAETEASAALTLRELEVLYWLGRGHTDKTAAALLNITPKTVSWHLQQAARKLGASTRTEAAVTATRLRLLEPFHLKYGRKRSLD